MLGAIFGDIAGSIYEFNNIKTTRFNLFNPSMSVTDDTILTVAVADWLLQESLSKEKLILTIKDYVRKYPHPMGGYGTRFSVWAKSEEVKPYNSWGNGSAMRVSPVGWAFGTLERTEEIAKLSAEITHNHPEGIKGAQVVAAAVFMARNSATKDQIKGYLESRYGYDLSRSCDEIRPQYYFNESCRETVPQAIIAFLESTDFESAIRLAVSLGGDSDTLACITGGIAEAFYGMQYTSSGSNFYQSEMAEFARSKLPSGLKRITEKFYTQFVKPVS